MPHFNEEERYRKRSEPPVHGVWRRLQQESNINRQKRILFVEKDDMLRGRSRSLISDAGEYSIDPVSTPHEALKRLEEQHFDLVILSWRRTDGYDCAEFIENVRSINCETPVILASFEPTKFTEKNAGADEVLDTRKLYYGRAFNRMEYWMTKGRNKSRPTDENH